LTDTLRVAECESEPELAVTVTVPDSGLEVPLPQALRPSRLIVATTHNIQTGLRRRRLKRRKHSVSARAATGAYPDGCGGLLLALALAVRVSVVETAVPDGVTTAGAKLHEVPKSNPEQLNDTAELNPFSGVTEIVVVPLCPAAIASDGGETVTEKSCAAILMVYVALATALLL
jgi:hypothetical protein